MGKKKVTCVANLVSSGVRLGFSLSSTLFGSLGLSGDDSSGEQMSSPAADKHNTDTSML